MDTICDKKQCNACKACVNKCPKQCIRMVADSLDVPYPEIDKAKCIDCDLCRKVCPNINNLHFHDTIQVLAAWSLDTETRKRSASGGVAVELYRHALENGWYTYGVSINRHKADYIEIKNIEDIEQVRNSKYVFSDTLDIYQNIQAKLKNGYNVLFIGLPCQVAGLYCFLGKAYSNLITVDIVCHGVVPNEYLRQHIERIEKNMKRKANLVYFRDPEFHTYNFHFTLADRDGVFYKKSVYEDDVYQLGYHKALIYRENCYHCQYAQKKRIGDLTICDFSGIGQLIPVNYDHLNISCVLVNTDSGEKMIRQLDDRLHMEQRPRKEAFDFEPQLNHPYTKHPHRDAFVSQYKRTHDFDYSASQALKKELNDYHPSVSRRVARKGKRLIKKIAFSSLYNKFRRTAVRLIHHPSTPFGAVLMLHRVDNPDYNGIWWNQHLKISSNTLEEMISYARKKNCRFVSLDEMTEALTEKKRHRRMITITLDDGYQDNYTNGLPLFTKMNIPFTIYVCTKVVKGDMLYWWEILEQLVRTHDSITLNDGRTFRCSTKEEKEYAFLDIREIILQLPQNYLEESLKQLFINYDIDYRFGNQTLGLTWEQINVLSQSPLATIGNHTYSHRAFASCTDDEIVSDIMKANQEMVNETGIKMQHFAFPFGEALAVSSHDIDLVKALDFKTSATTKEGFIRYNTNPLDLPRFFITEKNWKQVIDRIIEYC